MGPYFIQTVPKQRFFGATSTSFSLENQIPNHKINVVIARKKSYWQDKSYNCEIKVTMTR